MAKSVNRDLGKAEYWLKKAANQGDAQSQYLLGVMYYTGEGVTQDYKQARHWCEDRRAEIVWQPRD